MTTEQFRSTLVILGWKLKNDGANTFKRIAYKQSGVTITIYTTTKTAYITTKAGLAPQYLYYKDALEFIT